MSVGAYAASSVWLKPSSQLRVFNAPEQAHQVVQVDELLQRQELVSDELCLLRQPMNMDLLAVRTHTQLKVGHGTAAERVFSKRQD